MQRGLSAEKESVRGDTVSNMHEALRHCMLGVMMWLRRLSLLMQELNTFTYFR